MSFYTSVQFTRPTKPPRITAGNLAEFLTHFFDFGLVSDSGPIKLALRVGPAIDQDDRGFFWEKETSPSIFRAHSIQWDVEKQCDSHKELIAELRPQKEWLYRASLQLGMMTDSLYEYTRNGPFALEHCELHLDSWSLHLGPVQSCQLQSETIVAAGWMDLAMHGNGYLHPWRWSSLVKHLNQHPTLSQAMTLCRQTWPVPSVSPSVELITARKNMGELWPYPHSFDQPPDWQWTLAETG